MANRKIKISVIFGFVVIFLALFMFAYVSFAGNVKNSVKSNAIVNDDPTAKIQMTFNVSGSGDLVFMVEDPVTGEDLDWDITKPFVFNDLDPEYKSVDKIIVWHEELKLDSHYNFDLYIGEYYKDTVRTKIYGDFGSAITSNSLKGEAEYTKSFTADITLKDGLKGTVKLSSVIFEHETGEEIPVPNSKIMLLDKNGKTLRDVTTDEKGKYTINDLSEEEVTNTVFYLMGKDSMSDDFHMCDVSDWANSYNEISLETEENCSVILDKSENIENFKLKVEFYDPDEPEKFEIVVPRLHIPGFSSTNDIDPDISLKITETGSCLLSITYQSFVIETGEIIPLYSTGYIFDYWKINDKQYAAGQKVEWDMVSQLVASPFAKVAGDDPTPPSPDPTPTPVTPTSDVVSGNKTSVAAKTGDAFPLGIVFALIGVAGASAFVAHKRSKN